MMFSFSKYALFIVLGAFLALTYPASNSYSASCLPTCSSVDGKFIAIAEGNVFSTFTPSELNVRISVPAGKSQFSIGIFDGDSGFVEPDTFGFWDAGTGESPFRYTLRIDPDGDNFGPQILEVHSDDLPTNDWADFTLPVHQAALDEDGNYSYVLIITHLNNDPVLNGFKLRSDGTLFINEIFSFIAHWTSGSDLPVIYPNANFDDGIGPDDLEGSTYNGTISFFFNIPEGTEEIAEISLWDADCDKGNIDGTQFDTDDPNTPNTIPFFAPENSDALPEGVNAPPNPFDDGATEGLDLFLTVPPSITYRVIFPDGQEFVNNNPSGDQEWEKFTISTLTASPILTDYETDTIPAGRYEVRFEGLDMGNLCAIRPPLPFTVLGEVIEEPTIPPAQVPTISEWGLISVAVIMGILGIFAVRKRYKVS